VKVHSCTSDFINDSSFMVSNSSFFCCILHHYCIHHWLSSSTCLAHSVNGNIRSGSIKP
jgi:hypothetical protein